MVPKFNKIITPRLGKGNKAILKKVKQELRTHGMVLSGEVNLL